MLSVEYAAGFFDGEGCVNICAGKSSARCRSVKTTLRVTLGNTHRPVLEMFQRQFGGFIQTMKGRNQPVHTLVLSGGPAAEFLKAVQPFSVVKAEQVKVALEYWSFRKAPAEERYGPANEGKFGGNHYARLPGVLEKELEFKERLHALKGRASTRGRKVWNSPDAAGGQTQRET